MRSRTKAFLRVLSIGALLLVMAGLGVWRLGTASGDGATLSMAGVPGSVTAGGANFPVQISVAGVTNLAAYELQLAFDPNVVAFVSPSDGGFLGSTGRSVACPPAILPPSEGLEPGNVRYGCATVGSTPAGPPGGGLLSTATFHPVGPGAPNIGFVCAGLGNPFGDDIPVGNVAPCVSPVTPTAGPGETPGPNETPEPSPTPGGATATPTSTPAGPTATPTPLPPGTEAVDLAPGCNPVASTYPDGTPIQTLAGAVGPAGNLEALWEFEGGVWFGYSPAYPQASDLTAKDFLDVVFICVGGPGAFVRPIV
jgi:hypothetical protein